MKNTKYIALKAIEALVVLTCIIIVGIFVPTFISLIAVMVSEVTLLECMSTFPYILFSVIGTILAGVYINDQYTNRNEYL